MSATQTVAGIVDSDGHTHLPKTWSQVYYYIPETHSGQRDWFRHKIREQGLLRTDGSVYVGLVNEDGDRKILEAKARVEGRCPQARIYFEVGDFDPIYVNQKLESIKRTLTEELDLITDSINEVEAVYAGDVQWFKNDGKTPLDADSIAKRALDKTRATLALLDEQDAGAYRLGQSPGLQALAEEIRQRVKEKRGWIAQVRTRVEERMAKAKAERMGLGSLEGVDAV